MVYMTSKKTLRLGVIGGGWGIKHILGYQMCEDVEVVAFCDIIKKVAEATTKEFNIKHVFVEYHDLINFKDLDAVSIATPTYTHHAIATEALAQGKHVLCEKPLAMDVSEAEDMCEKAEKEGLIHMTGFEWRDMPALTYMKELIDQGYLGQMFHVNASWMTGSQADPSLPLTWRHQIDKASMGAMGGQGVHVIDTLRWIIGDFERVCGDNKIFIKERPLPDGSGGGKVTSEDACAFLAELRGGVQAVLHFSRVALKSRYYSMEIYGDNGMLHFKMDATTPNWALGMLRGAQKPDEAPQLISIPPCLTEGFRVNGGDLANYQFLLTPITRRFVQGIRENKQPEPSFRDGLEANRVVEAVYQSCKERQWISLDV